MPSKTEEYLALAQRTANGLTRYWESWTDYLTTASRLYKYPFADQLMIYAQRPDATACAEFDIWRNRMNRYVRRGSKGIALLDESSGFPRLHYVFDVSDTGVRRNSRDPEMWQYNDDLKQPVSEMLSKTYGISGERVSQQLADVAGKLVADYWDNNGGDIRAIVDGSLLMDYDEAGVEMQFKSAAAISVTYTLLERCGFEPAGWFDKDDFRAIHEFSTPDSVYALGAAVSDMSREVLRNIERTVKTTIRRRNAERSQYEYEQQERDLLDRRGLPAPEPDPEPAPEAAGQVRQAAPDVPDEPSPGAVQHDAPEREPVPAPDGGGADGREPDAADHEAASETEPGPGQGAESDGVGAAHEQPAGTVRGTGADGTDLQLSFFDAHIPTEAEQIETIDRAESEKTPSAFVLSQAEIENELRKHGSGFTGGKQRIMALYQTQPDRKLRAKALAKEYGIGGHSHDYLDGSRGFVNHDGRGMEFDHYPEHKKFTLSWTQVEKYIDLMIQSDRYLTDKEKEHYTPPVSAEPDATLTHAKNLIREFCQEEYDSEPDFSDLSKIGVAYTNATDENIPIQVNVDLVGYRVERYLGEVLIDERQYESLEELTETELEALDFSELVSVTDEELEHYHNKAEEHSALLPLDAATEYNTLKEQHPDALVGFEQGGQFEFYGEDARKVCELVGGKLLEKETELGTVPVTGFPRDQWAYRAKQLWQCGENIYLAGLNEDGTHHQTKYLRREDYLPLGATIHMEGRAFRVDTVNFDKGSVSLQDVALAEMRIPVFREEPLALVRELYEEQDMMESPLPDYKVGDNVVVELPTRTIEGKVGYVGETDVRIDTSTHGQSWDNEVINKQQFEEGLRQNEPNSTRPVRTEKTVAVYPAKENNLPFDIVIQTISTESPTVEAERPTLELAGNFRITDDHLGEGGAKQKYARNIEAIRTLFKLEQEHRGATAEEQQVLSQYVGWGGLADAFDPSKDSWAKEYAELKGLLSEDEYAAARSSTLNAHYTSPTVIRSIYDAVERMGFHSGNILEPSMGVGNFFGMLPDSMADSRLYGVELDSITGRIAKKLYPQADITVAGFETTDRRDFYDLAVGNVPFGQYKVNDKAYNKLGFSIHNADTEAKKAALFSKVRSGDVRVLLGSTAKMGAGTNVQSRLVAVHHLDVGWKPSDMTQRNGRIIRQGNMNKEVKVFNYVTEGTFDSYLFQTLENKQRFISQIMTSKSPVRSCEDVDEQALSYAEIKALCAGNPLIKEKMDLDVQVAKLKVLKADHQSQKFRLQDKLLTKFPADIRETNAYIAGVKADAQLAAAHPQVQEGFCGMTIKGVTYDEKKTAGERLVLACSELPNAEEKVIGSYRGFELSLRFDTFRSEYQAILKGERRYPVALGTDPLGNIIRLDNSLNNFPERINSAENELATLHQQQAAAQIEVEKPFPQEEELAEKSARLAELNAQLDVDEKNHEPEQDEEEQEDAPRRPSVLAALEEKSDKPEPVKPFRSYYDKDGDAR